MAFSSTPIAVPNHDFANMTLRLVSKVAQNTGAFGYKTQQYDYQQSRWEAEVTLPPLSQSQAKSWLAFFAKLDGTDGTFKMGYPVQTETPDVEIAATTSVEGHDSLYLRTTSGSATVSAGEYISIIENSNPRLYLLLEGASLNASSDEELHIRPRLRAATTTDLAVARNVPEGTWRLATPAFEFNVDMASRHGFTFSCVEAL